MNVRGRLSSIGMMNQHCNTYALTTNLYKTATLESQSTQRHLTIQGHLKKQCASCFSQHAQAQALLRAIFGGI